MDETLPAEPTRAAVAVAVGPAVHMVNSGTVVGPQVSIW